MSHALTIVVFSYFRLVPAFSVQNEVCIAISMGWGYCIFFYYLSISSFSSFTFYPLMLHEYALGFGLWNRLVGCIPRILESQNRIQSINLFAFNNVASTS